MSPNGLVASTTPPRAPPSPRWRTASDSEIAEFASAIDHPIRCKILECLGTKPVRQFELCEMLSRAMGRKNRKRYRTSLVHYHLRKLELSGLVTTTIVHGKKRSKLIYRNVDYRVKFKFRQNAGQMG